MIEREKETERERERDRKIERETREGERKCKIYFLMKVLTSTSCQEEAGAAKTVISFPSRA